MVQSCIGEAAPIVPNIGNFTSYLLGKLGRIVKAIKNIVCCPDSMTKILSQGLREKV
jgi:hypothetical protein